MDIFAGCEQAVGTGASADKVMTLACIPLLIKQLINFGFAAGGVTALVFIIISGIKFIQSKGDPKSAEGAKQTMTYAIIGLIVIVLAAAIVNFIGILTGTTGCITTFNTSFGNCPSK
ncbi:MAG TPA: pilin [Candidatus Saccharimonadales bacterium]|nr:pilin [Candidatus Saccharimonadales bacterium]